MYKIIFLFLLCACSQNKYHNLKTTVATIKLEEINACYKPFFFEKKKEGYLNISLNNVDNLYYNIQLKNAEITQLKNNLQIQKEYYNSILKSLNIDIIDN